MPLIRSKGPINLKDFYESKKEVVPLKSYVCERCGDDEWMIHILKCFWMDFLTIKYVGNKECIMVSCFKCDALRFCEWIYDPNGKFG